MIRFRPLALIFFLTLSLAVSAQNLGAFGEVSLSIGEAAPESLLVSNAYLFQDVEMVYDTSSQSQIGDETKFFYYPQLRQGSNRVLHLILSPASLNSSSGNVESDLFYDFYVEVGADFNDVVTFSGADSNVYIYRNGRFPAAKDYSRAENGRVELQPTQVENRTEGSIDIEFEFPSSTGGEWERMHIAGELKFSEDNFRQGGETALSDVAAPKMHRRNLVIALLTATIVILGTSL